MPIWQEDTNFLHAIDGTRIFFRQWRQSQAQGAVVLVHGLGEHSGRYDELVGVFLQAGLSVRIYDQRGHGRSEGARGSVRHGDDYLNDLKLVLDDFAAQEGVTPWLFGHSMGGLVAARFATSGLSQVQGLILSSPALALQMSAWQKILLAISTLIAPALAMPSSLPSQRLSHDNGAVQAYRADALNHARVSARVVNFMLDAMTQVQRDASVLSVPLLMQIAGDDAFVAPHGSRSFFARVTNADKTFYCYEQAYHEIFNEAPVYRRQAQHDLASWLALHLPSSALPQG